MLPPINEPGLKLPLTFVDGVMRRVFEDKLGHKPYNLSDFRRAVDLDRHGGLGMGYANPQTDLAWRMYVIGANSMYECPEPVLERIRLMS